MQLNCCELKARIQNTLIWGLGEWTENESKKWLALVFHKLNSAKSCLYIYPQLICYSLKLFAASIYYIVIQCWLPLSELDLAKISRFQFRNELSGNGVMRVDKQNWTRVLNEVNKLFAKIAQYLTLPLLEEWDEEGSFHTVERDSKTSLSFPSVSVGMNRPLRTRKTQGTNWCAQGTNKWERFLHERFILICSINKIYIQ